MARPLRIVLVYDCVFPDSVGGIERRNDELARALAERGHRVTLAGWHRPGSESRHGDRVRVEPLGPPATLYDENGRRRGSAALRFAWHCARLDVRRFDVVETANVPFLHLLPLALRCAFARRPLVVSWYEYWGSYWRSYLGGSFRWRLAEWIEAACARLGTLATASSRLTLDRLAHRRRNRRLRLLPCGIALERIESVLSAEDGARRGGAPPPLLYSGRLLPEKRLDLLLRAVARLPRELFPGERVLRVIGDGPDRERLERLATELGIEDRVELAGRLATGDEVFAAFAGVLVAVQPSRREGFGLFPLEAMASGLPVIYCASPESAVGELVRDGREGLEVEPRPEALAQAIERLLRSAEERNRLGAAGRRRARDYAWAEIASRAESLFLELLRKPGPAEDRDGGRGG